MLCHSRNDRSLYQITQAYIVKLVTYHGEKYDEQIVKKKNLSPTVWNGIDEREDTIRF